MFAWDPEKLQQVKSNLSAVGLTDNDIEAKMSYGIDYFHQRVERTVLPPSKHYWRVRAVFEVYGNRIDSKTSKPLFDAKNWKRANGVLRAILAGHAADPPGSSFYEQQLNAKGEPAFDSHGVPLLDCNRGTNDTECVHKQIISVFGTWCTGVEMSDRLMAEHRHCYNQGVSERQRRGFPKLGHYDTWLIESLQILVEKNHGRLLYPELSNTSDYIKTKERFGTVPLQSEELTAAINAIVLERDPNDARSVAIKNSDVGKTATIKGNRLYINGRKRPVLWRGAAHKDCTGTITSAEEKLKGKVAIEGPVGSFENPQSTLKLTPDQKYLCKVMGIQLPLLPVDGAKEHSLFERLVVALHPLDFDVMAVC